LVNTAKDFLSFQASQFEKEGKLEDPVLRTEAIRELVKSIALIPDELKRENFMLMLAKNFGIKESLLESELRKLTEKERKKRKFKEKLKTEGKEREFTGNINGATTALEKKFVELLFSGDMEILGELFDNVSPEEIKTPVFREIVSKIYDAYMEDIIGTSVLFEMLDDDLRKVAAEIVFEKETISDRWETDSETDSRQTKMKLAKDLINRFHLKNIEIQMARIKRELEEADDEKEKEHLLRKTQELLHEKKTLLKLIR